MRDHLLPPSLSDRALAPHDSEQLPSQSYISRGEPAGAGALRQRLDWGPLTRVLNKPLDTGLHQYLRLGVVDHSFIPTQQNSEGRAWHAQDLLLLSSGDKNGVQPPWAALSLTLAHKGRITKGKGSSTDQGGRGVQHLALKQHHGTHEEGESSTG
jgi:hypothetical protein